MKQSLLLILWMIPVISFSQNLNYDIYLIDIKKQEVGGLTFEKAVNISNHPGYDNQPSFTLDGKKVLYTTMTKDSTTDIQVYNIENKSTEKIKSSPKTSEYSPTDIGFNKLVYVCVEKDKSTQRIWMMSKGGKKATTFLPKIDSVGYICILPKNKMAAFILSSKNEMAHELRIFATKDSKETFIDDSIGRCIRLTPDSSAIVYIKKSSDGKNKLMRFNFHNSSITELFETPYKSEDFVFYDNNRIWMAADGKLYEYWMAAKFPHWTEMDEFTKGNPDLKNITRLNLSPDKTRLVLVAED